jgi:hypothetical protein
MALTMEPNMSGMETGGVSTRGRRDPPISSLLPRINSRALARCSSNATPKLALGLHL